MDYSVGLKLVIDGLLNLDKEGFNNTAFTQMTVDGLDNNPVIIKTPSGGGTLGHYLPFLNSEDDRFENDITIFKNETFLKEITFQYAGLQGIRRSNELKNDFLLYCITNKYYDKRQKKIVIPQFPRLFMRIPIKDVEIGVPINIGQYVRENIAINDDIGQIIPVEYAICLSVAYRSSAPNLISQIDYNFSKTGLYRFPLPYKTRFIATLVLNNRGKLSTF
jgi:hypothetical protein